MLVCLSLVSFSFSAHAQEIAILKSANIEAYNQAIDAFKKTVPRSLEITLEYDIQGEVGQGRKLARRIRASKADMVLAVGLKAALAAKLEILDIPVIFCMVLNPSQYDLTASNMTGITWKIPFREQIVPLKFVLPDITRIGVLHNPNKTGRFIEETDRQAKNMGLELVIREVTSETEVPGALRALVPEIQALWLLPDSTVLNEDSLNFLLSTTLDANIPIIGFSPGLVRSGALLGTHINYDDVGEQAAVLAKDMLNGEYTPAGMMITPQRQRHSINLKTANFLGLSLTPDVLEKFDEQY